MTVQTITPATNPFANDPDYYLGRADAYDHSHDRTVDQMVALMSMAIDHATTAYASGYADRVIEYRLEHDVVTAAETELAHTHPNTRKDQAA